MVFCVASAGGEEIRINLFSNTVCINLNYHFKIFSVSKEQLSFNSLAASLRLIDDAFIDSKGHSSFVPREARFAQMAQFADNRRFLTSILFRFPFMIHNS